MERYFDNSATTKPSERVIVAMERACREAWGNPSSLHSKGLEAERIIDEARKAILASLNVRTRGARLIFTASGTEADNLALIGTMLSKEKHKGKKLITTASEHPAVLESARYLETLGYKVIYLPCKGGIVDFDAYLKALDHDTVMVSIMHVNNETGAVYDIKKFFDAAKSVSKDIVTHTDAVQSFMKIRFAPESMNCDMVTLSAHKIHGPKGVGALYVSPDIIKRKLLVPRMLGGGQEQSMRSGTENVIGIAGFGEAVKAGIYPDSVSKLRSYIIERLPQDIRTNIPDGKTAPHIINVTLPDIKSETMLHFLSSKGIFVSSGSACSSNGGHENYVLPDFGLSPDEADCSIRISLDDTLTCEDADALLSALDEGISTLVKRSR